MVEILLNSDIPLTYFKYLEDVISYPLRAKTHNALSLILSVLNSTVKSVFPEISDET